MLSSSEHDTDFEGSSLIRYYLGLAYQALTRLPEAVEILRGSLERSEAVNGLDYPITEQIRVALAEALTSSGELDEAQGILAHVEKSGLPGLPKDHPIEAELDRAQGLLLQRRGELEKATAKFAEAVRIFKVRYGTDHWRVRRAESELADLQ
jgi:tetratricopeptide (TPR) repeat protein